MANYLDANGLNEYHQGIVSSFVPNTRTVNNKALSSNITLAASDVGAVPTSRTVNSKSLNSNITLSASDVGAVPTSRTVNSKSLNSNITLAASDVGAVPTTRTVNGKSLNSNITLGVSDFEWTHGIRGGTYQESLTGSGDSVLMRLASNTQGFVFLIGPSAGCSGIYGIGCTNAGTAYFYDLVAGADIAITRSSGNIRFTNNNSNNATMLVILCNGSYTV